MAPEELTPAHGLTYTRTVSFSERDNPEIQVTHGERAKVVPHVSTVNVIDDAFCCMDGVAANLILNGSSSAHQRTYLGRGSSFTLRGDSSLFLRSLSTRDPSNELDISTNSFVFTPYLEYPYARPNIFELAVGDLSFVNLENPSLSHQNKFKLVHKGG